MRMMKTLLSGFGPFGSVIVNPSARIAEQLGSEGVEGHDLHARVLPVSFARAAETIRLELATHRFDLALLVGVDSKGDRIKLERCARNRAGTAIPDSDGYQPTGSVLFDGPGVLTSKVDVDSLQAFLEDAGISLLISDDAGSYVCNHTYYAALEAIQLHDLPTRCLFIHVPLDPDAFAENSGVQALGRSDGQPDSSRMNLHDLVRAIRLTLTHLADRSGQPLLLDQNPPGDL